MIHIYIRLEQVIKTKQAQGGVQEFHHAGCAQKPRHSRYNLNPITEFILLFWIEIPS